MCRPAAKGLKVKTISKEVRRGERERERETASELSLRMTSS